MAWRSSLLVLLALGCGDDSVKPPNPDAPIDHGDACPLAAAIETPEGALMQNGERLDVIIGFQGFLFVRVLAAASSSASTLGGTVNIALDGQQPYEQAFADLALGPADPTGLRATPEMMIYFNQFPLETLSNRACRLVLRASDGRCAGTTTVDVLLSTDRQCYYGADGGITCVVDGGTGP